MSRGRAGGQGRAESWGPWSDVQRARVKARRGPCRVRSKASWVMVTWGPPCGQTE